MINLDLKNSFLESRFKKFSPKIAHYLKLISSRKQGFYQILDDKKILKEIKLFANKNSKKYSHIVILGIGGSALGTATIIQTLANLYQNKVLILDNIDPDLIAETEKLLDLKKTLFIITSKSGTNTEPLALYNHFRKKSPNFAFITGKNSPLHQIGKRENIPTFEIPANVGGRFSVLTAVGLLPAALMGIDINKIINGAKKMRASFLNKNSEKNLPFKLALTQYLSSKNGKNIHVLMPYSQHLSRFTDWYVQLLAESIGEKYDRKGKLVNSGITPLPALGVTDQHSQMQLFIEGPNDKLTIFMEVKNLTDKNHFGKLLKIEKDATAEALKKNHRPNITIKIDKLSAESLGELFLLFEGAIAFLGEFYNIDAYEQRGVELAKKLIAEALKNS